MRIGPDHPCHHEEEVRLINVTLRQLDYLRAVGDHGTVTAAAQALHLSQSAVSTAIADLERTLKVTLFVRHSRGLSLTRDGQAVLAEARRLLRDAESLERGAAALRAGLSGTIHIGCYSTIAPLLLPRIVTEFSQSYPELTLTFSEGSRSVLLRELSRGESDVAVLYHYRFGKQLEELGHAVTPLTAVAPHVLLPADHLLAGEQAVDLAQLVDEPLILFDLEPGGEYFLSLFEAQSLTPNVRFRTPNSELVRCLVARGAGYALLSQRPRTRVSHEGLPYVTKPLVHGDRGLEVVAVTSGGRSRSRRVAAFLEMAATTLNAVG